MAEVFNINLVESRKIITCEPSFAISSFGAKWWIGLYLIFGFYFLGKRKIGFVFQFPSGNKYKAYNYIIKAYNIIIFRIQFPD